MVVHLLRHTKPKIDVDVCYGQSDIEVGNTFKREQLLIQKTITALHFDVIFSSPLSRCVVLAQSLCPPDKVVIYDKRLKELNFGDWELKKWDDISKSEDAKKWFNDFVNTVCPGGESYLNLFERTRAFINHLRQSKTIKEPLIVTHAGIIRAFQCIVNGISIEKSFNLKVAYGEITTLSI